MLHNFFILLWSYSDFCATLNNLKPMKKTHLCLILAASCSAPAASAQSESTDSTHNVTNLEEVVVVGERAWIEGDKAVFIPSKREKNLAKDPVSLVDRMQIPTVIVDRGQIKSLSGQGVSIFINGEPAEQVDISTFWPKQTIRVEYMENPTDPKYRGATAVLNFVMPEYEVGGVTKLQAEQEIPDPGSYTAASKLVYRRMTYGVNFDGYYARNGSLDSEGEENFKGVWYDNKFYDNINHSFNSNTRNYQDKISTSFMARYSSDKWLVTHNAALLWDRNPGSGTQSADLWTPALFNSTSSRTESTGHTLSPQLFGRYAYQLTPRSYAAVNWQYSYAHNNRNTEYQNGDDFIYNATKENVHTGQINFNYANGLTQKFYLAAALTSQMRWFSTRYIGSADQLSRQHRGFTEASVRLVYSFNQQCMVALTPGVTINYWGTNTSESEVEVRPTARAYFYWSPSRKFNMNVSLDYYTHTPDASIASDVVVQQSNLVWVTGNPALSNFSTWNPSMYLTWLPAQPLQISLVANYSRTYNTFITINSAAHRSMGGIIKTYANAEPEDNYGLDLMLNFRFPGDHVRVQLQPTWRGQQFRGEYQGFIGWFRMRGVASYELGNCALAIGYGGPEKYSHNAGMNVGWHADKWFASFTYGNGNLYLDARVDNIFHTKAKSWDKTQSAVYDSFIRSSNIGRYFTVSVAYTFDYGKKIDRNFDIQGPDEVKSGAIKY